VSEPLFPVSRGVHDASARGQVMCDRCGERPFIFVRAQGLLCPECTVATETGWATEERRVRHWPRRVGVWLACVGRDIWWGLLDGLHAISRWGL
jgi:hypothetical protein